MVTAGGGEGRVRWVVGFLGKKGYNKSGQMGGVGYCGGLWLWWEECPF
jgi:hypothetical protein